MRLNYILTIITFISFTSISFACAVNDTVEQKASCNIKAAAEKPSLYAQLGNDKANDNKDYKSKIFTKKTLAEHHGQKGATAYVAVDGIVYDVTNVEAWKEGKHKNGLVAGKDVTNEYYNQAPHSASKDFLLRLNKVGVFSE